MTVNDIIYMLLDHIGTGVKWNMIFLGFFGSIFFIVKKFFPNLLKMTKG